MIRPCRRAALFVAALLSSSTPACNRAPKTASPPAIAREIGSPKDLLWGPCAVGGIGDVLMENGLLLAVITKRQRSNGFAMSPGNLVDLTRLPDGQDHFSELFLYINDDFPRQARYTSTEIVSRGGGKRAAVVRAIGVDSKDERVRIETEYRLEPGKSWMTIISRFTSTATATLPRYSIGDAIQWGRSQSMAPGYGFALADHRVDLDWIAGLGDRTSYAYVADGQQKLDTNNGSMWSDPIGPTVDLEPNKTFAYVRYLVVGTGDTASLAPAIARLRGDPVARVLGKVTSDGQAVADAVVRIFDTKDQLFGLAEVDDSGRYEIELLPGKYRALVLAPGRTATSPIEPAEPFFELDAGDTHAASFEMGARATLAWRIEGDDGRAPAIKLTVLGIEGTPTPDFGPMFRAEGAESFMLSSRGAGELALGPGQYRVIVSHGPEYELIEQNITAVAGERAVVSGRLERSVDTHGFISADLHQHSAPSFDSGVSIADRALSNAAEGVEVLVSTDHNVVLDYRSVIASQGLGRALTSIIGTEATTHSVGHFNAFPLTYAPAKLRGGMIDPEGLTPRQIFDYVRTLRVPDIEPFIQVNHPRSGKTGYFDLMALDPNTGLAQDQRFVTDFDAVEIVSFGRGEETNMAMRDWFALLRRGLRVTGTGNSDSHTISYREVGWPRTFVCIDNDDPSHLDVRAFTHALKRGCATVSAGPFVTIEADNVGMGGLLSEPSGRVEVDVTVQAPRWIPTDELTLFVDGVAVESIAMGSREVTRHRARHVISCEADCFVVALVLADEPLPPVFAQRPDHEPRAFAVTNPIYIDVDGNGRFDAPQASPAEKGSP